MDCFDIKLFVEHFESSKNWSCFMQHNHKISLQTYRTGGKLGKSRSVLLMKIKRKKKNPNQLEKKNQFILTGKIGQLDSITKYVQVSDSLKFKSFSVVQWLMSCMMSTLINPTLE